MTKITVMLVASLMFTGCAAVPLIAGIAAISTGTSWKLRQEQDGAPSSLPSRDVAVAALAQRAAWMRERTPDRAPIGFRDVAWWTPEREFRAAYPDARCRIVRGAARCTLATTIDGIPVTTRFWFGAGPPDARTLVRVEVWFASVNHDRLRRSLVETYGAATQERKDFGPRDRLGLPTENTFTAWEWTTATIVQARYWSDYYDRGVAVIRPRGGATD